MRNLWNEFKEIRLGILCVIGAMLIHISFGYFYTTGNMTPYLNSYLNLKKGEEIWFTSSSLAIQSIAMPTGSYLTKRFRYRIVVCLTCFIHSGSIILTYFSIKAGFFPTLLTYSMFTALYGLAYTLAVRLAMTWFPQKKGLIGGFVIGGFGAGAIVFNPIQYNFINPSNLKLNATTKHFDDPGLLSRIPSIFFICGLTVMGMQILGILLIRKKNEDQIEQKQSLSLIYFLKSAKFWLLWLIMLSATFPVTLFSALYKEYGFSLMIDDGFLTTTGLLTAVANCSGRVIWGFISDYLSYKPTLYMILTVWMICHLACILVPFALASECKTKGLFFILVMFSFSCIGGLFSVMPTTVARMFGTENMELGYGLVYSSFACGAIASGLLAQGIHGKWLSIFLSLACCNLFGGIFLAFVPDENINPRLNIFKPITDRIWGKKKHVKAKSIDVKLTE